MIDIHCHLLPGIDDGVKTFEDSLIVLRKAEAAGVTDVILTPHYMRGTVYNANNVKKWGIYNELKKRVKDAGIKVNLYLGNEIYIDEKLPEYLGGYLGEKDGEIYEVATENSGKFVLVELPVQAEDKSARATLFNLVLKGFVPVIAHPERYIYVQENPAYVDEFIKMGCVFQGDYLALLGKYGRAAEKTLKKLLEKGKIFCVASDLHRASDDYHLDAAQKKLQKIMKSDEKVDELLRVNPGLILRRV